MIKVATLKVQKWGNSLAVRIPAAIAKDAHFEEGVPVELSVDDGGVIVKALGQKKLSLAEKLRMFDPAKHGGEVMAVSRVGAEVC